MLHSEFHSELTDSVIAMLCFYPHVSSIPYYINRSPLFQLPFPQLLLSTSPPLYTYVTLNSYVTLNLATWFPHPSGVSPSVYEQTSFTSPSDFVPPSLRSPAFCHYCSVCASTLLRISTVPHYTTIHVYMYCIY